MGKGQGVLISVLRCLLCALAYWLPSVAAESASTASSHWRHPDPARPDAIAIIHGTPVRHHAFPPLSAPPPTAGADLPPGHAPPHFGFPLQPTFGSAAVPPVVGPSGEGYPFIGSNPTVPLPTGMTDTTTVLPMPDTGAATGAAPKDAGHAASVRAHITIIALPLFFSILFLLS